MVYVFILLFGVFRPGEGTYIGAEEVRWLREWASVPLIHFFLRLSIIMVIHLLALKKTTFFINLNKFIWLTWTIKFFRIYRYFEVSRLKLRIWNGHLIFAVLNNTSMLNFNFTNKFCITHGAEAWSSKPNVLESLQQSTSGAVSNDMHPEGWLCRLCYFKGLCRLEYTC